MALFLQSKPETQHRRGRNIADGIRAALLMPLKSRSQEDLLASTRDDAAVAMALTSLLLLRPEGPAADSRISGVRRAGVCMSWHVHIRICLCRL